MKLFDIFGKITDRISLSIKNSFVFGKNLNVGDTYNTIQKTSLINKDRQDIRRLEIMKENETLKAIAYYVDGTPDTKFQGYWYGWQIAPNSRLGVLWTPLGVLSEMQIPKGNFTEISVWLYKQDGPDGADHNLHAVYHCKQSNGDHT